jgi:hypothetical protein
MPFRRLETANLTLSVVLSSGILQQQQQQRSECNKYGDFDVATATTEKQHPKTIPRLLWRTSGRKGGVSDWHADSPIDALCFAGEQLDQNLRGFSVL